MVKGQPNRQQVSAIQNVFQLRADDQGTNKQWVPAEQNIFQLRAEVEYGPWVAQFSLEWYEGHDDIVQLRAEDEMQRMVDNINLELKVKGPTYLFTSSLELNSKHITYESSAQS